MLCLSLSRLQVRKRGLLLSVVRSMPGLDQFPSELAVALDERIGTRLLHMYGYPEEEELGIRSADALQGELTAQL